MAAPNSGTGIDSGLRDCEVVARCHCLNQVGRPGWNRLTARAPLVLRLAQRMPCYATAAADAGHVLAVAAHSFAALASCLPRFFGREPMRGAKGLRREATATGDLFLLLLVHRGETASARRARQDNWLNGHGDTSFWLGTRIRNGTRSASIGFLLRKQESNGCATRSDTAVLASELQGTCGKFSNA